MSSLLRLSPAPLRGARGHRCPRACRRAPQAAPRRAAPSCLAQPSASGNANQGAAAAVGEVTICFRGRGFRPYLTPARSDGTPIGAATPVAMEEAWWLASRGWYSVTMPMEGVDKASFVLTDEQGGNVYGAAVGGALMLDNRNAVVSVVGGEVHAASSGSPLLLVSDLDGTMVGDDEAGKEFAQLWQRRHAPAGGVLAYSTGRSLAQYESLAEERGEALLRPDALITAVGTRVYAPDGFGGAFAEDEDWSQQLRVSWYEKAAQEALEEVMAARSEEEVRALGEGDQSEFKRSLLARADVSQAVADELVAAVKARGYKAKAVVSGDGDFVYVDLLPEGAGKAASLEYVRDCFAIDPSRVVACGDSGNDTEMLAAAASAVAVGNSQPALMEWAAAAKAASDALAGENAEDGESTQQRLIISDAHMAAGIIEALGTLRLA